MAVSAHKKVLVARFEREPVEGFVQAPDAGTEALDLLRADGNLLSVPLAETKVVCFVRDFGMGETWQKHRAFSSRPKTNGLWIRVKFRDGDFLEGIVPNNLLQMEPNGFGMVPPDPTFQNQRLWVPRSALGSVEVLGVIGSPLKRRKPVAEGQLSMFE